MTEELMLRREVAGVRGLPCVEGILADTCRLTGMGFAAVARVTDSRWIACQILDRIDFGMEPDGELDIATTICSEIRASGAHVFIDDVDAEDLWRTHHTPALYGFKSYISVPIVLGDGSFFGTLCAIDPQPRPEGFRLGDVLDALRRMAARIADELTDELHQEKPLRLATG